MFTGIIRELGTVVARERADGVHRLRIHAPTLSRGLAVGESVAVNGVCLSAVQIRQGAVTFEMIPETCRLTTLGALRSGDRVNLEPSLTLSDRLNGHLVLGHIDGLGRIRRRAQQAGEVAVVLEEVAEPLHHCRTKWCREDHLCEGVFTAPCEVRKFRQR